LAPLTVDGRALSLSTGKDSESSLRRFGRAPLGATPLAPLNLTAHNRQRSISVFGAMTIDGMLAHHVYEGSLDSHGLLEILKAFVVSTDE
jgi:hypothetical protein